MKSFLPFIRTDPKPVVEISIASVVVWNQVGAAPLEEGVEQYKENESRGSF